MKKFIVFILTCIVCISCDKGSTTKLIITNTTSGNISCFFYTMNDVDSLTINKESSKEFKVFTYLVENVPVFKMNYDSIKIIENNNTVKMMYPDSTSSYKSMYNKDNWIFKDNKKGMYTYTYIFN
jgi:hypothetical protein